MGGNLWKYGRVSQERYLEIEGKVRAYLDERFGSDLYRIPRFYGTKPDFGDVDVILSAECCSRFVDGWEGVKRDIVETLQIEQYDDTSTFFSVAFCNFQVDFFLANHDVMLAKASFMDFNDLGNLIGRLFRPFNLKYGERGLEYVFRRRAVGGSYRRSLLVSRDWKAILEFVKLDYAAWEAGFHDMGQMFDWVMGSPYFQTHHYTNPKSPLLKKRAKQRTTMKCFLSYLEEKQMVRKAFFYNADVYLKRIDASFPEAKLLEFVRDERRKEKEVELIAAKFNGKLVMQWLLPECLEGKALGRFMSRLNKEITRDELLEKDGESIRKQVLALYETHKQDPHSS